MVDVRDTERLEDTAPTAKYRSYKWKGVTNIKFSSSWYLLAYARSKVDLPTGHRSV